MGTTHDCIIVGSGTAGGVIAHNLTMAGAKCLLLEAGKYLARETYPDNEADGSVQLFWGGGIEFSRDAKMGFLRGKVVGGGSVVNQALLDRFDSLAFEDWRTESGIDEFTPEGFDSYYQRAEDAVALHTFQEEERNRNAQLFVQGCESRGYQWHFLRRAQSHCGGEEENDCINCLSGCHRDSKQSTLVAFIRKAEPLGLEIHDRTTVQRIEEKPDGEVAVFAERDGDPVEYHAPALILAGGALGTTQLLLRSGFGTRYPALGHRFTTHPQFMFFGLFQEPVNAHKGMFQSVASKDPRFRKRGFKLENVFAGPASIAMLYSGLGKEHLRFMMKYTHLTCAEVAVRDEAAGRIRIDRKGRVIIEKPLTDQDRSRMADGVVVLKEILAASGAEKVIDTPIYFGLHLMGGAGIGTGPDRSVTGPDFRLHHHRRIFVCDSSLFPNAPGINPALTVMALAERLSEQLSGTT